LKVSNANGISHSLINLFKTKNISDYFYQNKIFVKNQ
jgi:hypothetical protein